jgi:hypothetical protein
MRLRAVCVSLCFASLLCIVNPALRADDWQPVTKDDLKISSAQAGGADAVILYHERSSDDSKNHGSEYRRIKILNERGKRFADVEIIYGSDGRFGTQVVNVKARVITPDGNIREVSPQVFDKTLIKGHGLKYKAKTFTFPDVQVGSIIEYRYTEIWSDEYVIAAKWILQEELAQKRLKFSYKPLDIDFDHTVRLAHGDLADGVYHVEIGLPAGASIKRSPQGVAELELKDVPAYEAEEFSPPAQMMKMRVYFYYGSSKMLKADEFWRQQGKFWSGDAERFIGHSAAVAQAAQQALSPSDTNEQKVRKVYAAVQKLARVSAAQYRDDFFDSFMERKTEVTSAEQALQKTASHDQLTRLFVAMVRSLGIPAYLMRIATREETFFQINVPDAHQLNSEIAIVTLDGKDVFLDPGTPLCPFGMLDWKRTNTRGIRQLANGATELGQTPLPAYRDAVSQRIADLHLEADGAVKGRVTMLWMGQEGLQRRVLGLQTDEAGRKKAAEDELIAMLPAGALVKLDSLDRFDEPEQPLKAAFTVEVPGAASTTGKRLILPSGLMEAKSRQMFVHKERKLPVYFDYPYRTIDQVQVTLPPTVQLENLPASDEARTEFSMCNVRRAATGNSLSFHRDFAIAGIAFPLDMYPMLKSFFEKVRSNDDAPVMLKVAAVSAANP